MDRRGFLKSLLGVAASSALPIPAERWLAEVAPSIPDEVLLNFTALDLQMNIDDFSRIVLEPAVRALANAIDRDILEGLSTSSTT